MTKMFYNKIKFSNLALAVNWEDFHHIRLFYVARQTDQVCWAFILKSSYPYVGCYIRCEDQKERMMVSAYRGHYE